MSNLKANIKAAQIDLIKELGIDKLDQAQKEELLTQIGEVIQQRVVLRIIEELPEEKQDDFQAVLEKAQEDPTQLDKFLEENIPDVENVVLDEIGEYKKGASDFMKQTLAHAGLADSEEKIPEEKEAELEKEFEVSTPTSTSAPVVSSVETPAEEELIEEEPVEAPVEEIESVPEEIKVVEPEIQTEEPEDSKEVIEGFENGVEKIEEPIETPVIPSGIEQEQANQEAQIIEENKVENTQVAGEELDLSNEIEKMAPLDNTDNQERE